MEFKSKIIKLSVALFVTIRVASRRIYILYWRARITMIREQQRYNPWYFMI
jgi:hypothetical protein